MIRLRELRLNKGLTMKQVGLALGLAESTISLYETEKRQPDISTLGRLADFFEVSVDYLLGREETPAPETHGGSEDREIREYLQLVKDDPKYRMMFDLTKDATLEEIKATVAFLKALREQE